MNAFQEERNDFLINSLLFSAVLPEVTTEIEDSLESVVVSSDIQSLQERQLRHRLEEKLQNLETVEKNKKVMTVIEDKNSPPQQPPTTVIVEDRLNPSSSAETIILSTTSPNVVAVAAQAAHSDRIPLLTSNTTKTKDPPLRVEVEPIPRIIEQPTTIIQTSTTSKSAAESGQIVTTDPHGQR